MTELESHIKNVDRKKVINAVKLQLPIEVTSYTLSRNMEAYFRAVEDEFLEVCHQEHLKEYLNFCLGELLTNSKKANTKRVYFKEKGLDINNPDDYAKGMETFKEDTFTNIDHYLELQKKEGLYVKLSLQLKGDKIYIEIKNNSILTSFEADRISHKLAIAQKYDDMDEVVANVIDQSEGAGLGIIIIILMLQKVGLSKENFKIFATDKETITQIIMPCDKKIFAGVEIISYEFVNLQTKIPVLQNNFDQANKLVTSSSIDRKELTTCIRNDVTLTLLLLKYALEKDSNCFSIPSALNLLSDDELRFVFSDSNPTCDFIFPRAELENLWSHSKRTAFFAYNLYKNDKNISTDSNEDEEYFYTAGLLNDFGKILLETASQEQKQYIEELSSHYEDISDKILDVFRLGNASSYLSLIYMRKFGFSETLANRLSSWNTIKKVEESSKDVVDILYLSELMGYYEDGTADFYQIDKNLLSKFDITDENQFKSAIQRLKDAM